MSDTDFDIIIVGAGVSGSIVAKELAQLQNTKILVLESGPETPPTERQEYMSTFYKNSVKTPESPYPPALFSDPSAEPTPRATVSDTFSSNVSAGWQQTLGNDDGFIFDPDVSYLLQKGPQPFLSTYERVAGGTTWHWLGTSLRFLKNDFRMKDVYGAGNPDYPLKNWPIQDTEMLPLYARAEAEIGVSATTSVQETDLASIGLEYPEGYEYPMPELPLSVVDQTVGDFVNGTDGYFGFGDQSIVVTPTPAGRNSQPYAQRRVCAGNTNCIPICPIQAKYDATVTMSNAQSTGNVTVLAQSVVKRVIAQSYGAPVTGVEYTTWKTENGVLTQSDPVTVTAKIYVIAAHAIETPKLLLLSDLGDGSGTVANSSDQVGRNLMDHPLYLSWSLMNQQIYGFRGPLTTAGIESLRDGPYRSDRAAWRVEIGNEGWNFSNGDPWTTTNDFISGTNMSGLNNQGPGGAAQTLFGTDLVNRLNDAFTRQWRMGFLVEQSPDPDSRVRIDRSLGITDGLGVPRPIIDYQLSEYTRRGFAYAEIFSRQVYAKMGVTNYTRNAQQVAGKGGAMVDNPNWFENPDPDVFGTLPPELMDPKVCARDANSVPQPVPLGFQYYGAGHLVGTYCMGDAAATSVVDKTSRSWDHSNLFLVGDGVFPTITTANPTLTLSALAFAAADAIKAQLQGA
ncbi:GMC family oxidoreductase [Ascidiaceihabitans sp.]|uniref:GMC family oxidoreductase n=1 Tax=Ascidiaceihabitans sp. TaxID=1872644 RepID=UPI003299E298